MINLPLIIQTSDLEKYLGDNNILIVDCCPKDKFLAAHIPGSVNLEPSRLQSGKPPASGSLPETNDLLNLFSELGIDQSKHIIAVDDEGGTWAGRLIWTLDLFGFNHCSYLDGGRTAWLGENRETESGEQETKRTNFIAEIDNSKRVYAETILTELPQDNFKVWDSRSLEEFNGTKVLAKRAGHMPKAFHVEWTELQQANNFKRLKNINEINALLKQKGVDNNSIIVTHCQSHRRSGLTWLVGRLLGLNIRAYDGSWGDWGNREDTPIE